MRFMITCRIPMDEGNAASRAMSRIPVGRTPNPAYVLGAKWWE